MQAIRTRYHGPTNTRGSRISATCEAGRVYVDYNHDLDLEGNHAAAARAMREKMGWPGVYHGGVFDHAHYWVRPWSDQANVRLIAAAPELLESLREVTRCLGWHAQQHPVGKDNVVVARARAAIAAATGDAA